MTTQRQLAITRSVRARFLPGGDLRARDGDEAADRSVKFFDLYLADAEKRVVPDPAPKREPDNSWSDYR